MALHESQAKITKTFHNKQHIWPFVISEGIASASISLAQKKSQPISKKEALRTISPRKPIADTNRISLPGDCALVSKPTSLRFPDRLKAPFPFFKILHISGFVGVCKVGFVATLADGCFFSNGLPYWASRTTTPEIPVKPPMSHYVLWISQLSLAYPHTHPRKALSHCKASSHYGGVSGASQFLEGVWGVSPFRVHRMR